MDRFTWGVVGAVALLSVAAIISVFLVRSAQPTPDLSTPEGIVTAYILAIQDKNADRAWELLSGPEALSGRSSPSGLLETQDSFRNRVNNVYRQGDKHLRIVHTRIMGDNANVEVEIANVAQGPAIFFGSSYTRTVNFSLVRRSESWRINSAPYVYELG